MVPLSEKSQSWKDFISCAPFSNSKKNKKHAPLQRDMFVGLIFVGFHVGIQSVSRQDEVQQSMVWFPRHNPRLFSFPYPHHM